MELFGTDLFCVSFLLSFLFFANDPKEKIAKCHKKWYSIFFLSFSLLPANEDGVKQEGVVGFAPGRGPSEVVGLDATTVEVMIYTTTSQ